MESPPGLSKTKAVHEEVEKIIKVVNLIQSEESELDILLGEINSLNCSIDTIIKQASNNDGKEEAENERVKQGVQDISIPSAVVDSRTTSNIMKLDNPCTKIGRRSSKQ